MPPGTLSRRALLAGGTAAGVAGVLTACAAIGAGRASSPSAAPRSAASRAAEPTPTPAPTSPATPLALSVRSGALRGGTAVTATGSELRGIRSVTVGGTAASISATGDGRVSFVAPAATDFAAGAVPVAFIDPSGAALARSTWTYRAVDGVDRQLAYVLKYWKHYNPAWTALPDDDCVDFTSQALLVRGWKQQDEWYHAPDILDSGAAWRGSTAFMSFMQAHPSLGTALTDRQRSRVKVGDIVQFDWDRSGDRDHTGTVTRVVKSGGRWQVFFAGHTNDSDFRSVDTAITKDHPGGVAYYWSLA